MQHAIPIRLIRELDWRTFNPLSIIHVSYFTAVEFAESLRETLKLFPDASTLQEMAEGELQTDNLHYGDYPQAGDHADFLRHFLTGMNADVHVNAAYDEYRRAVEALRPEERGMTIISREQELPGIFQEIIESHEWDRLGFGFYRYYLERHIQLDSQEGGHGDLTTQFSTGKSFTLEPDALDRFWTARLKLYTEALLPRGSRT